MIKKRIFESGRSLVEMLGVLAVIGVLSVGAIAGYRRAIDSQKASATIAELNQYALLASQQALQKRADLDLSELGNVTNQGYPISAVVQADPTFFEIFLKDVPTSICERILDSDWSVPLVMFANNYAYTGETGICDNGEDELADMAFQFKEDLNPDAMPMGGCVQDSDCKGSCVKCENQQCVSTCVGSERCATDQATGEKVCCPSEKRAGPMCCSSKQNGWCCNTGGQCCPWHKPLVDKNGKCYSCDNEAAIDVTGVTENCSACSNREVINDKSCVLKCPMDKPFRGQHGMCYSCDNESSLEMYGHSLCSEICPNRQKVDRFCALLCSENMFYSSNGTCYKCDDPSIVSMSSKTKDQCNICNNPKRTLYTTQSYSGGTIYSCILDCPKGQFRGGDGQCYDCSHEDPVDLLLYDATYCQEACPNRMAAGFRDKYCALPCGENEFFDSNGVCHPCDEIEIQSTGYIHHEGCDQCTNRTLYGSADSAFCVLNCPKNQIRGKDGVCYDCNISEPLDTGRYYCENYCSSVCPNRVAGGMLRIYCILPCGDNQFTNDKGECISCDYDKNVNLGHEKTHDCYKCPSTRNQYNNQCVPKCPAETPLRGSDNKCYACDDPARINVFGINDACYECPDERKLDGNYCVLK